MKRVYNNYFLVGLFTILIGGSALYLMFKMSGKQTQSDSYYSYFENVTGLGYGNPVYFEGYRVGQVEQITPEYHEKKLRFKTEYTLIKGWRVPVDSSTVIQSSGLLSDMSLNISSGESFDLLSPNSEIPAKVGADLMATVAKLAEDFDELNEEKITPLLDLVYERVDNLTASLDKQIPEILDSLQILIKDVNQLVDTANGLLNEDNIQGVENIIANIENLSKEINQLSDWLETSFTKVNELLQTGETLVGDSGVQINDILSVATQMMNTLNSRADTITSELESASMNVNEAMDTIRKDPSTLIFDKKSEIADEDL
jgi:phospholipid/cholesterol/gamma-HCH transport system substrate-binding protein